jgi:CHAT domain-containing protein
MMHSGNPAFPRKKLAIVISLLVLVSLGALLRSRLRNLATEEPYPVRRAIEARVIGSFDRTPPWTPHERGIAELLSGNSEAAVATLEGALSLFEEVGDPAVAIRGEKDASLLNDLAAAYLTRNASNVPLDSFQAVQAAEQAWRLRQSPEIAWNRSLALEAVRLRAPAVRAWLDFIQIEPQQQWRVEAWRHTRRLTLPTLAQRWASWLAIAEEAGAEVPIPSSKEFAQDLRSFGEEDLLREWATASIALSVRADSALAMAEGIGFELAHSGGDALLLDTIALIRGSEKDPVRLRRLAEAHLLYAQARREYARQEMVEAISLFDSAERLFRAVGSPFALRATIFAATGEYYAARQEAALRRLDRMALTLGSRSKRYPVLVGQIGWVRGLILFSRGQTNEALAAYAGALTAFERAREIESRAGIEALIAQTYRVVGQNALAGSYQRRALASVERLGKTRRRHAVLTDAAQAASTQGAPLTALFFQDVVVDMARASKDAVSIADALIGRSVYAASAGERTSAGANLIEAGNEIRRIADPAMHRRSLANLLAAEATVQRTFDPKRAASAAESAIARMQGLGHRIRLLQLHLEAGRAFAQTMKTEKALAHWRDGIAECERQRALLTNDEYRQTYFNTCRALFEESIAKLTDQKRFAAALALAERSRARGLLDIIRRQISSDGGATKAQTSLPSSVTVVEYSVLPDRVVVWVVRGTRIVATVRMVNRAALRRRVDQLLASRAMDRSFQTLSLGLYQLLVAPIRAQMTERVIFIPDDVLYRIPFAALHDGRSSFLIERHEISIAPSMALLNSSRAVEEDRGLPVVLIGADQSTAAGQPSLPAVHGEIARLRMLYRRTRVLEGKACTKDNVIPALEGASLVHFAGHALTRTRTVDPALVLVPARGDDGLLYPREITRLDMDRTRLVVLGACGTADGQNGSEGPLSIARAFLAAGAGSVMATLWEIDDERSSSLLGSFHRALKNDLRPEQALRTVQLNAIHQGTAPADWAAFEILHTMLEEPQGGKDE